MSSIDQAVTRKIAHLARLKLTDSEVTSFTQELEKILGLVQTLQNVDTSGIQPMNHPLDMELSLRMDDAQDFERDAQGQPKVTQHAPETLYGGYKVPQIL